MGSSGAQNIATPSYQATDLPILITATGVPSDVGEHTKPVRADDHVKSLVWRFNLGRTLTLTEY